MIANSFGHPIRGSTTRTTAFSIAQQEWSTGIRSASGPATRTVRVSTVQSVCVPTMVLNTYGPVRVAEFSMRTGISISISTLISSGPHWSAWKKGEELERENRVESKIRKYPAHPDHADQNRPPTRRVILGFRCRRTSFDQAHSRPRSVDRATRVTHSTGGRS